MSKKEKEFNSSPLEESSYGESPLDAMLTSFISLSRNVAEFGYSGGGDGIPPGENNFFMASDFALNFLFYSRSERTEQDNENLMRDSIQFITDLIGNGNPGVTLQSQLERLNEAINLSEEIDRNEIPPEVIEILMLDSGYSNLDFYNRAAEFVRAANPDFDESDVLLTHYPLVINDNLYLAIKQTNVEHTGIKKHFIIRFHDEEIIGLDSLSELLDFLSKESPVDGAEIELTAESLGLDGVPEDISAFSLQEIFGLFEEIAEKKASL